MREAAVKKVEAPSGKSKRRRATAIPLGSRTKLRPTVSSLVPLPSVTHLATRLATAMWCGEPTEIYKQLEARQRLAEAEPLEVGMKLEWSG